MKSQSVLIVERDPEEAEKIVEFFEKQGFRNGIDVVHSKSEAMEYVFHIGKYSNVPNHQTPGLILLDLLTDQTPHVQLLKPLHLYLRTIEIPIIILTSSEEQEKEIDSYTLGVVGYVRKPFDFTSFVEVLQRVSTSTLSFQQEKKTI